MKHCKTCDMDMEEQRITCVMCGKEMFPRFLLHYKEGRCGCTEDRIVRKDLCLSCEKRLRKNDG